MKYMESIMALAAPKAEMTNINLFQLRKLYNTVHVFPLPEGTGEFPDTSGYTDDNWEQLATEMEDSQLWPHMTKCMDCIVDTVTKRADKLCNLNFINVRQTIQWPKEGGKVFMVVGFINYETPDLIIPVKQRQRVLIPH